MSIKIRDAAGKEITVAGIGGGSSANAVTVPGGAAVTMEEGLGEGPYEFEFTQEEDAPELSASEVGYDGTGSGLEAETVQSAIDKLSSVKADAWRVSNPNLLDNWYLANPINQRGQSAYKMGGYCLDRWMLGAGGPSVLLVTGGLQFTSASGEISQRLDCAWEDIAGKTFTVSFLTTDGELAFASGTIPQVKPTVTTEYIRAEGSVIFRMSYSAVAKLPYASFLWSQANTTTVIAAKLELGSVQTLAHKDEYGAWVLNDPAPDYATELLKCQRYFERSVWNVCLAVALSNNEIRFCGSYYFKTVKAKSPSIAVGTALEGQEIRVYDTISKTEFSGLTAVAPIAYNRSVFSPRVQDPQNRFVPGRVYQIIIPDNQYNISADL